LHEFILEEFLDGGKRSTFFSTLPHSGLHADEVKISPQTWQAVVREAAARAVGEDVGPDDVTSRLLIPPDLKATGFLVAREPCVLAGMDVAEAVFREVDGQLKWRAMAQDGEQILVGRKVAEVTGSARSVLTGERCALNFIQRLSGVATLTAEYVRQTEGTVAKILDTRKTTPGLRALERQAVRLGGGTNHRTGLYDGILVKENHLALVSLSNLPGILRKASQDHPDLSIVVEADNCELAKKLLQLPIQRVLLDNMTLKQVGEIVATRKKLASQVEIEASGGVTLEKARDLARAGVDWISVGKLTHSARSIDFSLDLIPG
jgi:nicotinate-nucleotide pyrophosphorylase (carboxylating)